MSNRRSNYLRELRERAVRMVAEVDGEYPSEWLAAVASKLGIGRAETLRKWVRRTEVDAGQRPGITSEERSEIRELKREVAELREIITLHYLDWFTNRRLYGEDGDIPPVKLEQAYYRQHRHSA